jgi:PAS domain S-box-containing protein
MEQPFTPQAILDFLPDAVIVTDIGGRITSVNQRAESMFGYVAASLIGSSVALLVPDDVRMNHHTHIEKYASSPAVRQMGKGFPLRGRRSDGSCFPAEISLSPHTHDGATHIICIVRDVSDRQFLEDEIREGEERYHTLLDQSPEPIVVHSMGTVVYANNAMVRLLLLNSADDMIGHQLMEFVPPDHIDEARRHIEEGPQSGETRNTWIVKTRRRDGRILYLDAIAAWVVYRGQPAAQVILRDLSELMEREEELRASREELRNLSSYLQSAREAERTSIARELHDELGSALTALKMDVQSLDELIPPDGHASVRHEFEERIATMSSLIDSTVQTMRRIVTELRPALLDSLGLIAAIEWHAEEFEQRTGVSCRLGPHPDEVTIDRDRATAVFRIFQETLTNVARHAAASRVDVDLRIEDTSLLLAVADNGRGFSADSASNSTSFGILGMRERALIFQGELTISGEPGIGTIVTLRIPLLSPSIAENI